MKSVDLFVNRFFELIFLDEILLREKKEQIVYFCVEGGKGKTYLLDKLIEKCQKRQIPYSIINFNKKYQSSPSTCMREIAEQLDDQNFPKFNQQDIEFLSSKPIIQIGGGVDSSSNVSLSGVIHKTNFDHVAGRDNIEINEINIYNDQANLDQRNSIVQLLSKTFRNELKELCNSRTIVLIFGKLENADLETILWLEKNFLNPIKLGLYPNLIIILSGCPEGNRPDFNPFIEWEGILKIITSFSEFSLDEVRSYLIDKRHIDISEEDLRSYFKICKNDPFIMGQIADILQKK